MLAIGVPNVVLEIQIGTVGTAISEQLSATHAQFVHHAIPKCLVEVAVGVLLNRKAILLQKRKVLDKIRWLIEVNEHAYPAVLRGPEYGSQSFAAENGGKVRFSGWRRISSRR